MKTRNLLIVAFFVPTLFCHAQDKEPAQVAAPAPAGLASAAGAAIDSYVIGASDVLTITVWKEPTLSGSLLVRPDGMVSVPLLGDVQASGMTPLQLADQISTKLKKMCIRDRPTAQR